MVYLARQLFSRTWRDELIMVLLGITGGSVFFLAENYAVGLTYVNNVSFIVCTAPLLTVTTWYYLCEEYQSKLVIDSRFVDSLDGCCHRYL